MKRVRCGVCRRERERRSCQIVVLTDKERKDLEDQGVEVEAEYVYCKPCWTALSDPVTGPNFAKGLVQQRLQQFGVSDAEGVATRYHAKLVDKLAKPKPS
jgi:hypothetical protein